MKYNLTWVKQAQTFEELTIRLENFEEELREMISLDKHAEICTERLNDFIKDILGEE